MISSSRFRSHVPPMWVNMDFSWKRPSRASTFFSAIQVHFCLDRSRRTLSISSAAFAAGTSLGVASWARLGPARATANPIVKTHAVRRLMRPPKLKGKAYADPDGSPLRPVPWKWGLAWLRRLLDGLLGHVQA